jgi:hypothetical protein
MPTETPSAASHHCCLPVGQPKGSSVGSSSPDVRLVSKRMLALEDIPYCTYSVGRRSVAVSTLLLTYNGDQISRIVYMQMPDSPG